MLIQMVTGKTNTTPFHLAETNSALWERGLHLSILNRKSVFQWVVTETIEDTVLEIGSVLIVPQSDFESISDVFNEYGLHKRSYDSVSYAIGGTPCAFIPNGLLELQQSESYLQLQHSAEDAKVLSNDLIGTSSHVVYEMSNELSDTIKAYFPQAKAYCNSELVVLQLVKKLKFVQGKYMFVEVFKEGMDLYCMEKGNLFLFNSFEGTDVQDVLYYASNAAEQLSWPLADVKMQIASQWRVGGHEEQFLKEYISEVNTNMGYGLTKISLGLSSAKKHHFVSILNQYACV